MGAPAKGRKSDGLTATQKSHESHKGCRAVAWRRRAPSVRRAARVIHRTAHSLITSPRQVPIPQGRRTVGGPGGQHQDPIASGRPTSDADSGVHVLRIHQNTGVGPAS
jgi:hypothetical protein